MEIPVRSLSQETRTFIDQLEIRYHEDVKIVQSCYDELQTHVNMPIKLKFNLVKLSDSLKVSLEAIKNLPDDMFAKISPIDTFRNNIEAAHDTVMNILTAKRDPAGRVIFKRRQMDLERSLKKAAKNLEESIDRWRDHTKGEPPQMDMSASLWARIRAGRFYDEDGPMCGKRSTEDEESQGKGTRPRRTKRKTARATITVSRREDSEESD